MNNRKFTKILVVPMALLMLVACSKGDSDRNAEAVLDEIVHYGVEAKTDSFESLDEIENKADVIIRGVRLENEESVIKKSGENVLSTYTFSEIKVTEVYKNSTSEISEGEIITILENEAYDEASKVVYHVAGYNMMVEGKEYILFLEENELGNETYYVSVGVNYGTVSVEDDGRRKVYNTRAGNPSVDFEIYETIWEAAKEKYK